MFFLALFQYMPIEKFLGIDFLFLGLFFSAYFLKVSRVFLFAIIIVILNWLLTRQLLLFNSACYIFLPFLAYKIKATLDLNFKKYCTLGIIVFCIYICIGLAGMKLLGVKNFTIIIIRNLVASFIIYTIIRLTAISQLSLTKNSI